MIYLLFQIIMVAWLLDIIQLMQRTNSMGNGMILMTQVCLSYIVIQKLYQAQLMFYTISEKISSLMETLITKQ